MFKNIFICSLFLISIILSENKNKLEILKSLNPSKKIVMKNSSRKLYTIVNDKKKFDKLFLNSSFSCGYIIRYFFNTEIILGFHTNKLVSLDDSIFYLNTKNENTEKLTQEFIKIISSMFYGSKEFEIFKDSINKKINLN